jgi:predicted RNase H-like HicB family nuclease
MKARYVYWQEDGAWLGYLEKFPDYWTQGMSMEDLQEHLRDLYNDLTNGAAQVHPSSDRKRAV